MQILGVRVSSALIPMTNLEYKLPSTVELQQHVIGIARRGRRTVAVIAADPHEPRRIYVDAMFPLRPIETGAESAPTLDVASTRIKFQYGRRGFGLLLGRNGAGAMKNPNPILRINRYRRNFAEYPIVWDRWPGRIRLKRRLTRGV